MNYKTKLGMFIIGIMTLLLLPLSGNAVVSVRVVYNYSDTTNNTAFDDILDQLTQPPAWGSLDASPLIASAGEYSQINISDNSRWRTTVTSSAGNIEPWQIFNFTINESSSNIINMTFTLEGLCGLCDAGETYNFYYANYSGAGSWVHIGNSTGTTEATRSLTLTSGFANVLNNSRISIIAVGAELDYDIFGFNNEYIETDYAGVEIWFYDYPPTFATNTTNNTAPVINQAIQFNITWDDDVALSSCIFSWDNGTGTFVNDSTIALNGGSSVVCSNNKTIERIAGTTMQWKWYANDSSNQWNTTTTYNILVLNDTTFPTFASNITNNTAPNNNQAVQFNLTWTDDITLSFCIFSWDNGTGTFVNDSAVTLSGSSVVCSNNKTIERIAGTTMQWKWYANDSSNNWNVSTTYTFIVNSSFLDTTNHDFLNGTLVNLNISGISHTSNLTLNYNNVAANATSPKNTSATYINYSVSGNLTSRIFDSGFTNSTFSTLASTIRLTNSTDIVGFILANAIQDFGVFYANRSIAVNLTQSNLSGNFTVTQGARYFNMSNGFNATDIIGVGWDEDFSSDMFLFMKNGTVLVDTNQLNLATDITFTLAANRFFIPAGFSTDDVIGIANEIATDVAPEHYGIFFKNGSYAVDDGGSAPFNFSTVRKFTVPSGFDLADAIGVVIDDTQTDADPIPNDIAIFFGDGRYVSNNNTNLSVDNIQFNETYTLTYPSSGYNLTEKTNISFLVRVSNSSTPTEAFTSVTLNGGNNIPTPNIGRYIQYAATFYSPSVEVTPFLSDTTIFYTQGSNLTQDSLPPTFSANSTNNTAPKINEAVNFSITISDGTALSYHIFSWDNGTGTFANDSAVLISGTSFNANVTKTIERIAGTTMQWKWFANDSSNNWNQSTTYSVVVADTAVTTPTIINPANNSNFTSTPILLNYSSVDADSDTITYYVYINGTLNGTTTGNWSFNATNSTYTWNVMAGTTLANSSNSSIQQFGIDSILPTFSNNITNDTSVTQNEAVQFNITITDTIVGLAGFTFSYDNGTGVFVNDTFRILSGTSAIVSVNKTIQTSAGALMTWKWFANDTVGNENQSGNYSFVVQSGTDLIPPSFASNITNNTAPKINEAMQFNITWTDTGLASCIFSWDNGTGTFVNDSAVALSGASAVCSHNKTIDRIPGTSMQWRWSANDTAGNWNNTPIYSVRVANRNPSIVYVNFTGALTLTGYANTQMYLLFNISDADGVLDINDTSANATISNTSNLTQNTISRNSTCLVTNSSTTIKRYNCTVYVPYFTKDGVWYTNVSACDNSTSCAQNFSEIFIINTLDYVNSSNATIIWNSVLSLTTNNLANNTIIFSNGGNQKYTQMNITSYNSTFGSSFIPAENYSIDNVSNANGEMQLQANTTKNWTSFGFLDKCPYPCATTNSTDKPAFWFVDVGAAIPGNYTSMSNWAIDIIN